MHILNLNHLILTINKPFKYYINIWSKLIRTKTQKHTEINMRIKIKLPKHSYSDPDHQTGLIPKWKLNNLQHQGIYDFASKDTYTRKINRQLRNMFTPQSNSFSGFSESNRTSLLFPKTIRIEISCYKMLQQIKFSYMKRSNIKIYCWLVWNVAQSIMAPL